METKRRGIFIDNQTKFFSSADLTKHLFTFLTVEDKCRSICRVNKKFREQTWLCFDCYSQLPSLDWESLPDTEDKGSWKWPNLYTMKWCTAIAHDIYELFENWDLEDNWDEADFVVMCDLIASFYGEFYHQCVDSSDKSVTNYSKRNEPYMITPKSAYAIMAESQQVYKFTFTSTVHTRLEVDFLLENIPDNVKSCLNDDHWFAQLEQCFIRQLKKLQIGRGIMPNCIGEAFAFNCLMRWYDEDLVHEVNFPTYDIDGNVAHIWDMIELEDNGCYHDFCWLINNEATHLIPETLPENWFKPYDWEDVFSHFQ